MKVICHNTDYARDWHLIEPSDLLEVGKVYTVEEVIEMDNGELFYFLEEKPKNSMWRVRYNANRFVVLPEGKEPHEIKLPVTKKLTEEEDFVRKMKRLKMPDETIQHFLNSFQKEK